MPKIFYLPLFTLTLFLVFSSATATNDKELRQQQKAAQKERQVQKQQRAEILNMAKKDFREYTRNLKKEYQDKLAEFKIDFKLKQVDLQAEHAAKVAEAESENQKKILNLFMVPNIKLNQPTLERLQKEATTFSDELFALKKQSAKQIHQERVAFEKRKNKLLTDRDRMALDKASKLGMTKNYAPIIATPIGDSLTKNEKRWNKRENKEVVKLKERNQKILSEFTNGEKLRDWKLQKMNDDFKLTWEEKSKLHELDTQYLFFNTILMQAVLGGEIDQQELITKISEINKNKKLINIDYKKIREKNRINRNKERKAISSLTREIGHNNITTGNSINTEGMGTGFSGESHVDTGDHVIEKDKHETEFEIKRSSE